MQVDAGGFPDYRSVVHESYSAGSDCRGPTRVARHVGVNAAIRPAASNECIHQSDRAIYERALRPAEIAAHYRTARVTRPQ